jgi:hypothetical protein
MQQTKARVTSSTFSPISQYLSSTVREQAPSKGSFHPEGISVNFAICMRQATSENNRLA